MSIVYVDLSAKVEQWERDSAIAACNDTTRVLLIPGRVKQQMRRLLIRQHGRQTTHYRAFAMFIYCAVREDLLQIQQLVIDRDYSGAQAEATIKNVLLSLLQRDRPGVTAGFIRFANVKGSRADLLARNVFRGKVPADRMISYQELVTILTQ